MSVAQTGTPRMKFFVPSTGVDDPPPVARPARAVLLAHDRVARAHRCQPLADRPLDGSVGLGHRRGVRLRLHPQVDRPEVPHGDRVGGVGELESER
jgi:hypothetical protein